MADVFALLQRLAGSPPARHQSPALATLATPATAPTAQGEGKPSRVAMVAWVATAPDQAVAPVHPWRPAPVEVPPSASAAVVALFNSIPAGSAARSTDDRLHASDERPGVSRAEILAQLDETAQRLLEQCGLPADAAVRRAREIIGSELRNDPRLTPPQPDPSLCLMCGKPGGPQRVLAAVLTPRKDEFLWLHLDPCHASYVRQQTEKVVSILRLIESSLFSPMKAFPTEVHEE